MLSEIECLIVLVTLSVYKKLKRNLLIFSLLRNSVPPIFDAFEYIPSLGAFGGSIMICKSYLFIGTKVFQHEYCLPLELCSKFNNDIWILSNIYAPCTYAGKREFVAWFKNIQMLESVN